MQIRAAHTTHLTHAIQNIHAPRPPCGIGCQSGHHNALLSDPAITWGPAYGSECLLLTRRCCVDLTEVTLVNEDITLILAHANKRAIPGNMAMQVVPPGG